jgi:hypothetical protein
LFGFHGQTQLELRIQFVFTKLTACLMADHWTFVRDVPKSLVEAVIRLHQNFCSDMSLHCPPARATAMAYFRHCYAGESEAEPPHLPYRRDLAPFREGL